LRGKILNVEKARIDKMLANNEIKSLVIALGTNIGEKFSLEELRYDKIIIMTDADVDGAHIRTLLLTMFYRYFVELINQGHVYIAQPPLYKIQRGKEIYYAYTDEQKNEILKKNLNIKQVDQVKEGMEDDAEKNNEEDKKNKPSGVSIQRYKGLGEMNPQQLWETTMDPVSRLLLQVTIEDAARADETFAILMGSDVAPRKKFISTHAKSVKNLDV
jgi:DNA gyrase subunit B